MALSAASATVGTRRSASPPGWTSRPTRRCGSWARPSDGLPIRVRPSSGAWRSTSPSRPGWGGSSPPSCGPAWRTPCTSGSASAAASSRAWRSTEPRAAWVELIEQGRAYREDITVGGEPWLRGQWADRLPAIDDALGDMERELETSPAPEGPAAAPLASLDPVPPPHDYEHAPPASFRRGRPVPIELSVGTVDGGEVSARLRYRHVSDASMDRSAAWHCGTAALLAVGCGHRGNPVPHASAPWTRYPCQSLPVDRPYRHDGVEHGIVHLAEDGAARAAGPVSGVAHDRFTLRLLQRLPAHFSIPDRQTKRPAPPNRQAGLTSADRLEGFGYSPAVRVNHARTRARNWATANGFVM